MDTHAELIGQLQTLLDRAASPKTKDWWEKYLRHVIPFRGVGIPEIRRQLAEWRKTTGVAAWPAADQLRLVLSLFESGIAEDKLAGICSYRTICTTALPGRCCFQNTNYSLLAG
jgi:hypothetical protein